MPTAEVFEVIAEKFEKALKDSNFKGKETLKRQKNNRNIKCDLKRLQTTYSNLKQKWRKFTNTKKNLVLV